MSKWSLIRDELERLGVPKEMWQGLRRNEALAWVVIVDTTVRTYYIKSQRAAARLRREARYGYTDPLTGLSNRAAMNKALDREVRRAYRSKSPLTFQLADIDRFKYVNDTLGHQAGDDVLRDVGVVYRTVTRVTDVPFRYGGDEVGVIMLDTGWEGGLMLTRRLAESLAEKFRRYDEQARGTRYGGLSMSFGLACYEPEHEEPGSQEDASPKRLIGLADRAMYKAKRSSKSICVWSRGEFELY